MLITLHLHLKTITYQAAIELVRDHCLCTYLAYRDRNKTLCSLPGFPHRISHIWPHVWRVKHKHCTKEEKLFFFLLYRNCSNLSLHIRMYCRWIQLLSWNPITCFCNEQHSFNKCTLPCRRDLPGATACLERKCCLMNIYWLWIFIKLTSLWPAPGFVAYVAVKWLSKVFKPVLEPFEARITIKITKTSSFLLERKAILEIFRCGYICHQCILF